MIGFWGGFWFAWSAVRGGEGAVFFGRVVAGGVHADDLPVGGELDRPGDQGDLDRAAGPGPASPIHDAGERHCAVGVSDAGDGGTGAGAAGSPLGDRLPLSPFEIVVATLDAGGDQHASVQDLDQAGVERQPPTQRRARRPRGGPSVTRVADRNGAVSFAGVMYRAGRAWTRRSIEVSLVAGSVQLSADGQIIRVHAARHDRAKEHGAFATPHGRPRRTKPAPEADHVADLPNSIRRTGTGT